MTAQAAEQWVNRHHGYATRAIRELLRRDGDPKTDGEQRRRCNDNAADHMLELITYSGIQGTPGLTYLAGLIRYAYGYRHHPPYAPDAKLTADDAAFIRRRALELVSEPGRLTARNTIAA